MRRKNLNFKALSRSMGVPTSTNKERINYTARGKQLTPEHYQRLMKQREVFKHPTLPIAVIKTNHNRTIKFIDTVRMVELRIFNGVYPYLIIDGQVITAHKVSIESYANRLVGDNESVHHCNLNKQDFDFENLIIIDKKLHNEFHRYINAS